MSLIAVRAIDLAILGSMGALWVFGATFIYFVWRWVIRYDRENSDSSTPSTPAEALETASVTSDAKPPVGRTLAAREALVG